MNLQHDRSRLSPYRSPLTMRSPLKTLRDTTYIFIRCVLATHREDVMKIQKCVAGTRVRNLQMASPLRQTRRYLRYLACLLLVFIPRILATRATAAC